MDALKEIGIIIAATLGGAIAVAALRWLWAKAKAAAFVTRYKLESTVDAIFGQAVIMTEAYAERIKTKDGVNMTGPEKATKALEIVNQLLKEKAIKVPENAPEKINNAVMMMNAAGTAASRPQ